MHLANCRSRTSPTDFSDEASRMAGRGWFDGSGGRCRNRNGIVELARDHPAGAVGLDQGSDWTGRDARLRLLRPGANGSGDPDVVRNALGGGSHLRGNPAPPWDRDPAPMGGSGDPAHHAAAARVVLAGDAVARRTDGADRQAAGAWRCVVQEPGPDIL